MKYMNTRMKKCHIYIYTSDGNEYSKIDHIFEYENQIRIFVK